MGYINSTSLNRKENVLCCTCGIGDGHFVGDSLVMKSCCFVVIRFDTVVIRYLGAEACCVGGVQLSPTLLRLGVLLLCML